MHLTREAVASEHAWVRNRSDRIVPLINEIRDQLGDVFDTDVGTISTAEYHASVDAVFADGDRGVNVAAYVGLLRDLDVEDDYHGFIVDEVLGRELARTIAGGQPSAELAQATFHVADVMTHSPGGAGVDDLDAALAAGFQTRLPGWEWREGPSPFTVNVTDEGRDGRSGN